MSKHFFLHHKTIQETRGKGCNSLSCLRCMHNCMYSVHFMKAQTYQLWCKHMCNTNTHAHFSEPFNLSCNSSPLSFVIIFVRSNVKGAVGCGGCRLDTDVWSVRQQYVNTVHAFTTTKWFGWCGFYWQIFTMYIFGLLNNFSIKTANFTWCDSSPFIMALIQDVSLSLLFLSCKSTLNKWKIEFPTASVNCWLCTCATGAYIC